MSKLQFYNEAKRQFQELGKPLPKRWNERGSTTEYWKNQVNENNITITRIIKRRQQRRTRTIEEELQNKITNQLIRKNDFQRIINRAINQNITIDNNQAQRLWNNIQGLNRFVINIEGNGISQNIPVNNRTKGFLLNILTEGILRLEENYNWGGSDILENMNITEITSMTVNILTPNRIINNRDGRFFGYINTSELDLSKYQIYNQEQAYNKNLKREHCLINTLEQQGITKEILNSIKLSYVAGVNIRKKDLHNIAKKINRNINIHTMKRERITIQKIKGKNKLLVPPSKEQLDREHEEFMKEFNEPNDLTKSNNSDDMNVSDNSEDYEFIINEEDIEAIHNQHIEEFNERGKERIEEDNKPDINIAMYDNHYFTYEETEYSKYSINNYDELKDEEDFKNITKTTIKKDKKYYTRNNKSKINSLILVDKFYKADKFKKLDLVKFEEASSNINTRNHIYLNNIENEQRRCEANDLTKSLFFKEKPNNSDDMNVSDNSKEKEEKPKPTIYYADCESFVSNVENHELYLLGCVNDTEDWVSIYNVCDERFKEKEECKSEKLVINEWLKDMTNNGKNNAICYFHNLKYDYHLLEQYLNIKNRCEKDGQLYNVICKFKSKEIELRDSYKLLPFALSKFGDEFDLPQAIRKKEAISYEYYNRENNNKLCNVIDYSELLSKSDQSTFWKQINNESSFDGNQTFNPLEYYKEYLRLDCLVLKKGIQKFNQLIQEITDNKMSVYESLTISSLTDKYMKIEGAYKGVYEVQGNLRAYIAEAVYGGRVSVNEKYKKKIVEGKISDYDGVSLYPSAINRLCRELGLPKGKAKRFTPNDTNDLKVSNNSISNWKNKTYSIMTVKITKVNKIQQMPFIAQKEKGSIKYINSVPDKPLIIDSITLEDYIKFHKIEYELLEGIYWDEGGNNKMGEVIQRLFNARLQAKKEGKKALSNTIKLMLNSSYGKTIMKKSKQEKVIVKTHKYNKVNGKWVKQERTNIQNYIYNNFNTIKSYRQLNNECYEIERIKADDSYNRGHIGCAILSTSKRIMNEVFDIANDNMMPIYYTDTDSLHCNLEDVPRLENAFRTIYKKELNGANLEQFHTDFDLNGAKEEIYATKSIFLGKKSYIDVLESKDKNGDRINGYHIRLKGITKEGLEDQSKKYKNSYLGLYEDLAKGEEIEITLNPFNIDENKNKVLFDFKNGKVSTKKEFKRKVKF